MRLGNSLFWLAGLAVSCLASQAISAEADPRALESCKKTSADFTAIAKCLPNADVAVAIFDEFDRTYDPAATPLKNKCIQLNGDDISGAATCTLSAISDAISLKASLPKGATIDDPIFSAVADERKQGRLLAAEKSARAKYPDVSLWGGNFYKPYR
ncbi:hypothetical protein [Mesorhizobium sp. B2-4-11]|uniref:hypothetical protein n=1 Tax=Mesorhizobium sp. B2-4-11 TaxID=2589938 RepID=UPI0011264AF0|nr:hypothetical protein [Mesorhizobium sp. B2-4-11]TPL06689.1 hypothetical protein FJ944_22945 [Mesorhizobium sp. B2-4-11]